MTQAISSMNATSFASELAMLEIENESNQSDSAKLERDAARQSFLSNAQHQVDALHDAASATMAGALVSASLSVAGGACTIAGAFNQFDADTNAAKLKSLDDCSPKSDIRALAESVAQDSKAATIWNTVGKSTSELAAPLKALVGDSASQEAQASAKRYETLAQQAQWQASDASSSIDKADKRGDKVLDTLQSIQSDQNASNNAIIGRI